MTGWPFTSRRERARREASRWIARLNAPGGERDRPAFDRWYRADPAHAAAFDRLSSLFELAGRLRPMAPPAPRRAEPRGWPAGRYAMATGVAGLCLLVAALAVIGSRQAERSAGRPAQTAVFVAVDQSETVRLADGSEVVLAAGSELDVDIGARVRALRLKRGEARFRVFHEPRPFVVAAAGARVVARGTEFVVSLGKTGALVSLIEGRVEVSYPTRRAGGGVRVTRLAPGQRLLVPPEPPAGAGPPAAAAPRPKAAMVEFDDIALSNAIDRMAPAGQRPVRLADPALGRLRVTGAFRAGDAESFARSVAAALGLRLARSADGTLWLHPRRAPVPGP